jgi:hypothetical protein
MPVTLAAGLLMLLAAAALCGVGLLLVRSSGARPLTAIRFARLRELPVGKLTGLGSVPDDPFRVVGRIRCADPLVTADEERLVAFHRDVEVEIPGSGWRTVERVRETRSFELWDHAGSVTVDPTDATEPLIVIPRTWHGAPEELDASYTPALERVTAEAGVPRSARATTRTISVVERLWLSGVAGRGPNGSVTLQPPPGGHLISTLEPADAMRLLGGPHRGRLLTGMGFIGLGVVGLVGGLTLSLVGALAGA